MNRFVKTVHHNYVKIYIIQILVIYVLVYKSMLYD